MKFTNFLTLCCLGFLLLASASCSSSTTPKPVSPAKPAQWDYQKIRETRQASEEQDAALPPKNEEGDETLNCVMLSETQKKRARASNCRPLDANAGYGENMFCCEREDD